MIQRELPPGRYGFDDVDVGDTIRTATRLIDAALIDGFADLTGDRFEIHMDEAAAARYGFAGRVAHGLLVLSIIDGLKNQTPAQFKAIASLGWTWSFRAPVIAGDTISAVITIADKRTTRHADRGILRLGFEVLNQRDDLVQEGENQLMVEV